VGGGLAAPSALAAAASVASPPSTLDVSGFGAVADA
jgi:hypothetical protein